MNLSFKLENVTINPVLRGVIITVRGGLISEWLIVGCIFFFTSRYGPINGRAQKWGRFMSRSLRYLIFYERCHSGRDVSAKKKPAKNWPLVQLTWS